MLQEFFDTVLPHSGGAVALCVAPPATPEDEKPQMLTVFREPVADIVAFIGELVADEANGSYLDAYFSIGRYAPSRRLAANATGKRALVFDIDLNVLRNGKPVPSYTTKAEALAAFDVACPQLGLPLPTWTIDSGRGIHVYWAFTRDVTVAEFTALASDFKTAIRAADPLLAVDTTRVADLAGIIRLPGSWNTRSQTRCMPLLDRCSRALVDPVTFAEITRKAAGAPAVSLAGSPAATGALAGIGPLVTLRSQGGAVRDMGINTPLPSAESKGIPDPVKLLDQCVPLDRLRVSGDQSYEAWFGVARLFAHADDEAEGLAAFHEFSKGHSGYDPRATEDKFYEAKRRTSASPSCQDLRLWSGCKAADCMACPMFQAQPANGKPAALQREFLSAPPTTALGFQKAQGVDVEAAAMDAAVALLQTARAARRGPGRFVQADTILEVDRVFRDPYHPLWAVPGPDASGVFVDRESGCLISKTVDEKKNVTMTRIATAVIVPIRFVRIIEDGVVAYTHELAVLKKVQNITRHAPADLPDQSGVTVVAADWVAELTRMDKAASASRGEPATLAKEFLRLGLPVSVATPQSKAQLVRYFDKLTRRLDSSRSVEAENAYGWRDKDDPAARRFILGDRMYRAKSTPTLIPLVGDAERFAQKFPQRGSMAQAKSLMSLAFDNATPVMKVLMFASLGSPLLTMTDSMGAVVFISGQTGAGKTAAMSYVNSFYGDSRPEGIISNGSDTYKSMFKIMGTLSHLPAFLDEMTMQTDEGVAQVLMQITQGKENHRMQAGVNELREASSWNLIAIVSANDSISDKIMRVSEAAAAQQARAVDLRGTIERRIKAGLSPFWETGNTADMVARLVQPSHSCCGLIGSDFVQYVLDNYDAVHTRVREALVEVKAHMNGGDTGADEMRYHHAIYACALVAAEIALKRGYIMSYGPFFEQMVNAANEVAAQSKEDALASTTSVIVDFIVAHQETSAVISVRDPQLQKLPTQPREGQGKESVAHTPTKSPAMRFEFIEGSDDVMVVIHRLRFSEWLRRTPAAQIAVRNGTSKPSVDFIVREGKRAGLVVGDGEFTKFMLGAQLPTTNTGVSTADGSHLIPSSSFAVRLRLAKPYQRNMPVDFLNA